MIATPATPVRHLRSVEDDGARTSMANAVKSAARVKLWEEEKPVRKNGSITNRLEDKLRHCLEHSKEFQKNPNNPIAAVQVMFSAHDKNLNGKIEHDEFSKLCKSIGLDAEDDDLAALQWKYDLDKKGYLTVDEFCRFLFKFDGDHEFKAKSAIARMREVLVLRAGGYDSLRKLALQFSIIDRDRNGKLSKEEFDIALDCLFSAYEVHFSVAEKNALMRRFDSGRTGYIDYDHFVRGVRGDMNDFRVSLVKQAFSLLDHGKSGVVEAADIAHLYDVCCNPLVKTGKMSKAGAVQMFMDHCDYNGDHKITLAEFIENYQWISCNIDSDEYFELMMRNAWHMTDGKGAAENTANLRVLVQHREGPDEVVEVVHDLALPEDACEKRAEIVRRLEQQGVKDIKNVYLGGACE